jgi:hypothetical protein
MPVSTFGGYRRRRHRGRGLWDSIKSGIGYIGSHVAPAALSALGSIAVKKALGGRRRRRTHRRRVHIGGVYSDYVGTGRRSVMGMMGMRRRRRRRSRMVGGGPLSMITGLLGLGRRRRHRRRIGMGTRSRSHFGGRRRRRVRFARRLIPGA